MSEAEKEPTWKKFLKHFHDVLIYVLLVAAGVTAILDIKCEYLSWRSRCSLKRSSNSLLL
ncbi:cation-transporting P-type ATPase [Salipaludibacillus sp. CUR1]|uniref:cation-transporting P-type ATPase n=1 Tax=Salipaludibacillus sp. CUR1 TaxID=2820003 RepID=UPI00351D42DE